MNDDRISEDEFWEAWRVVMKPGGELLDHSYVAGQSLNRVWTIVESGNDANERWYACPGLHVVNRLGYVMTEVAWASKERDAIFRDIFLWT